MLLLMLHIIHYITIIINIHLVYYNKNDMIHQNYKQ